jgi:peptide/nickel transport system substrate-binding protein
LLAAKVPSSQPCPPRLYPLTFIPGGQLVFSDWQPLSDLNVIGSRSTVTQEVSRGSVWSSLWIFTPENKPYPDLVSEIPTTQNGDVVAKDSTHMDLTIKLQKGLAWSDGTALTTRDVAFTLKAICDPATRAISRAGYDHIASTEIMSDQVMVWHFGPNRKGVCGLSSDLSSGIYAPYLTLNLTPLPQAVLGNIPHQDWSTSGYFTRDPLITSGPHRVETFRPGASAILTLMRNAHYGDGRVGNALQHAAPLDRLVFRSFPSKQAEIAAVRAGQSDLALHLEADDLPALRGWPGGFAEYANGLRDEFLNLNLGNDTPWQDDALLRQAIDLAIDKDGLNRQLVDGIGHTLNSVFPSDLAPYYDTSLPRFGRDVAAANATLDQDGWVRGADATRVKNGRRLAWKLTIPAGDALRAAEAGMLIGNWRDIGAAVSVTNVPASLLDADFSSGGIQATGQFDMALDSRLWGPDPDAWADTILPSQVPSAENPLGQNWGRVNDPTLASLFMTGASRVDIPTRVGIYKQVQAEWAVFKPTIGLYEVPEVFGVGQFFGNFFPTVNPCLATCNAADWYRKR